ncbi:unnamed protein product [Adineta ricciae]|uniref:F-box domain-containing protein n=1 Tax=Adineta ricciae TaxID=249248 RepID=A0A815FSA8_ADIRI|nr:unnamed protein product [Adineta ricciae]CAF1356451.1 unnamed protein product [Adineta ricciae]
MITTLEHFAVELFWEIFSYLQIHEIFESFFQLNSRFVAMLNNLSHIPVFLGFNGMSRAVSEFYYKYLSESKISGALVSLCVSNTLAIGNDFWLVEHVCTFLNLRHLSLIDIQRSSFQSILNSLSSIHSLIFFNINFSSENRAAYTFHDVPEGAFHDQIFHLFPFLRECNLLFRRNANPTLDRQFILPLGSTFLPVQNSLINLQKLTIRCSSSFLLHLFERLPQLKELIYIQTNPWLPSNHPRRHTLHNQIKPINKHLAPNLCRLRIAWFNTIVNVNTINGLFERDVLFSLTKFSLSAEVDGPNVLQDLQSKLSNQCLYSFDVKWHVKQIISQSESDQIFSNIFHQLKGSAPIRLQMYLLGYHYFIRASTIPVLDTDLCVSLYLDKNTVHKQSPWSYNQCLLNNQLIRCNKIIMNKENGQINEKFLSLSPPIVPWHQITTLSIAEPFHRNHLHVLFSQATSLRTLELHYRAVYHFHVPWEEESLINLLDDSFLCNILMSNGLRQLNLFIVWQQSNLLDIAYSIIARLPHLQIMEIHGYIYDVTEMSHILINGLEKLTFLTLNDIIRCGEVNEKELRAKQRILNTRSFRTEVPKTIDDDTLFIWL